MFRTTLTTLALAGAAVGLTTTSAVAADEGYPTADAASLGVDHAASVDVWCLADAASLGLDAQRSCTGG